MEFEKLARNLAANLLELRQKRNLTQVGLAELTGLPRSTIANLESGVGNPSLTNLAKLQASLNTPIEKLLSPEQGKCIIIPADKIPYHEKMQGLVKIFKLLPDTNSYMKIERLELKTGGQFRGVPHAHGTKEYCHCIQGEITIHVLGTKYKLQKGDVLAFPGDVNHAYANNGRLLTVAMSVVFLAPLS